MSPTNFGQNEYPHLKRMSEIEVECIKTWNPIKLWKLNKEYKALQRYGFALGMEIAFKDLEECGLLKKVSPQEFNS